MASLLLPETHVSLLPIRFPKKPDIVLTLMGVFIDNGLEGIVLDGRRKQEVFPVDTSVLTDIFHADIRAGHHPQEYLLHMDPLPHKIRIMNRKLFYMHHGRLWGLKYVSLDGQWIGKKLFITLHLINKNDKGEKVEDTMELECPQEFTQALYNKFFN